MDRLSKVLIVTAIMLIYGLSCSEAAEKDDYLTIKLDRFPDVQDIKKGAVGLSRVVPGSEQDTSTKEIVPVGVRLYPMGKPLQVTQSYVPGNAEAVDDVSRFIATTTNRYVPEFYAGVRNSYSSAEYINRLFLNLYYPVSNNLAVGLGVYGGMFDLVENGDEDSISTGVLQVAFEGRYRINPEMNFYGAIILGSTYSVVSPGLRARFEYLNRGGIEFKANAYLWTPWAENTIGVYNNGRSSGLGVEATLPFTHDLRLDLNAGVDWRYTAKDSFEMDTYEGTDLTGGARLTWDFFSRDYRQLPVEFMSRDYLLNETVSSRAGLFASVQASQYFRRGDAEEALVPVVDDSVDQRIGLNAAYAFTSHLAVTTELYIGYDPARNIDFGKLFGFDSRLVYVPTSRLKIYGEIALDSDLATGLAEGSTWYYGAGLNYKF